MQNTLRWNTDSLVEMAVTGQISQPTMRPNGYVHYPDGKGTVLPAKKHPALRPYAGQERR